MRVPAGKSNFDVLLPATYEVLNSAVNTSLVNNVAAGSHRLVSQHPLLALAFSESAALQHGTYDTVDMKHCMLSNSAALHQVC